MKYKIMLGVIVGLLLGNLITFFVKGNIIIKNIFGVNYYFFIKLLTILVCIILVSVVKLPERK